MSQEGKVELEKQNKARDTTFSKALHSGLTTSSGENSVVFNKERNAKQAAFHEYFEHWGNGRLKVETGYIRKVSMTYLKILKSSLRFNRNIVILDSRKYQSLLLTTCGSDGLSMLP